MKINWKNEVKQLLKSELVRRNITHEQLVNYLANIGIQESKSSIDSKLSRGTFSASFLIQCLAHHQFRVSNNNPGRNLGWTFPIQSVISKQIKGYS